MRPRELFLEDADIREHHDPLQRSCISEKCKSPSRVGKIRFRSSSGVRDELRDELDVGLMETQYIAR